MFEDEDAWQDAGRPEVMLRPVQAVRDYKVDLAVLDEQARELARKVVQINEPLHFGGYHIYLDRMVGTSVRLLVKSDEGLYWVYAGFALLLLGVVIRLWIRPLWRALAAHRTRPVPQTGDGGWD